MLRFGRLRRAEGHVAFAVPGSKISAMASADSRRMGNGGSVGGAFQLYLDSLRQELWQRDPTLLSVVVALVAVLLTLVFWKFIRSRRSSQRAVLLVGLCDSGKTLLFVRLLTGLYRDTQTSITDSSAAYRINNNRGTSLTLIDLPGHESLRLQFLERFKASASNTLRVTRSAAPSILDSSSTATAQLGKKGKEFEFSQLPLKVEFLECSAKGGRGDAGSADIQDLEKWLAKIA
ncbi:signal recognition particle receptor subunit beta [Sagmatias obliquidens]|uniref:signal recognition particle receptor subunit beta n=1 Tax=Sagmatias obliquidens TaxID=3371155 RepID=UPI000F44503A|nr:signal recognition particle receptor subunit beta [Lagenorhynchus obliquidens]